VYLSTAHGPHRTARAGQRVAGTVVALGAVSLVTDVSTEMVTAVLPLYLVLNLHLGPVLYGVVDGAYTGATALLRVVGGYVADRFRRRKLVAGAGYGLSTMAKLGLVAAGASVPAISAVLVADRAGKGLRTPARDALITLASPPDRLGRAFGVHRAMDSTGAFAGPLVAFAVLAWTAQAYDAVFVTSFCFGVLGVLLLVLFVPERTGPVPVGPVPAPPRLAAAAGLLRDRRLRLLVAAAALVGLATIGDGFVYLVLQRRDDLAVAWFPLLAVGTNAAYLLLAVPLGMLGDRVGRARVWLGGFAALVLVYLLLALPRGGWSLLVLILALYGAFYAATDGMLMALAGPLLPADLRTTGLALVQSGQALAYLGSSVLFGLGWRFLGPGRALLVAAAAGVVTAGVVAGLLGRLREPDAVAA
jgi:MFS family permease